VPSANLDLVRSIYAGRERGDYSAVDWAHPEVELVFVDGPHPGTWKGLAGMARGWREWLSAWEDFRVEVEEFKEIDADRVLVLVNLKGHGKSSGVELEQIGAPGAAVYQLRGGKVVKVTAYWDRERAVADLGLASTG
jgi:ketosteroid isomerase-like protein